MGESKKQAFQLSYNRFLRVGFLGSRVTSDGGLILRYCQVKQFGGILAARRHR